MHAPANSWMLCRRSNTYPRLAAVGFRTTYRIGDLGGFGDGSAFNFR